MKSTKKWPNLWPLPTLFPLPSTKNISTTTPLHVDIINVWCPSLTKKLILRTSKRDPSVENPVCSHLMVYNCNKDSVDSSSPAFISSEISHWPTDSNDEETSGEASANAFQHVFLINPVNLPNWLHPVSAWKPRSDVHSSGPRWLCNVEDECHDLLYEKLYYCITHQNNKVTAGWHQFHINTLPDQYMGYIWLRQVNAAQYSTCISFLVTMIL